MFNINFCKNLLTAYLNQAWTRSGSSSSTNPTVTTVTNSIPTDVYLAFGHKTDSSEPLSVNSSNQIQNFTEVEHTADNSYKRIRLTDNGVGGNKLLSAVNTETQSATITVDPTGQSPTTITVDAHPAAYIKNSQEYIVSNYTGESANAGSGWGNTVEGTYTIIPVDAFVIFSGSTGTSNAIFYGDIDDGNGQGVTVGKNVVPIILKDQFKITLG